MRMTFHTDYALRMLVYVAMRPDRICTVSEIAESYGLSRNHMLKVAQTLAKLGYVETIRGRAGGVRLGKPAAQINIGDCVRATEEDFSLVECMQSTGGVCILSPTCRLKGMFSEALSAYLAVLDKYTLADAVRNRRDLELLLGVKTIAA